MIMCQRCSLVQLRHSAPQELLYSRFYWYRSGVTQTMKKALRDITSKVEAMIRLQKGDVVLDIGSNDGTLLRTYAVKDLVTVGVEPANNLSKEGKQGLTHFINDFWAIDPYEKVVKKKAKVITAIGMFYDMEDPNQFIRDAAAALSEDGVFIAQLMCLKNMLDSNDIGNICHEHLEFYSLEALEYLLKRNGLETIDLEHNEVNGGSYRIYARRRDGNTKALPGAAGRIQKYRDSEKGLETQEMHNAFFKRIEDNKNQCVKFIRNEVSKGKKVWVYGASTKGNTILQHFGLDHTLIEGASERSPEKWGKYTIGTQIPIYSENEARKRRPDYFLVLPYAFFNEFYKREKEWRSQGGKFILPLPEFKVVA
jgi:NDP-4-keto-2,6-dideoxyhexose 3-C-methyltransferase